MRLPRTVLWAGALVAVAAAAGPAPAGWNNVFQVCCNHCGKAPATANYYAAYQAPADACCPQPCPPPPCQVCETRYVQRTYYAPETHYETQTRYEPVTTYRTSYYWEPVVNYRVSSYYDPSTCCYKQISQPCTSYRLREQCCPVQSFVARCYSVPVTTMKPYTRCEPVTSCYWATATASGLVPINPPAAGGGAGAGVNDNRVPANVGQPGVNDTAPGGSSQSEKRYDPYAPQGYRPAAPPGAPPKAAPQVPVRPENFVLGPPPARLEKIRPIPPANDGRDEQGKLTSR